MTDDFLTRLEADPPGEDLRQLLGDRALFAVNCARVRAEIAGKRVLITGAGGSIGSALALSLLDFDPASLVLLDAAENNLFLIERALSGVARGTGVFPVFGDIADGALLGELFDSFAPEVIFHAAAYKHVALLEGQPVAAVRNNVVGTYALLRGAGRRGTRKIVLLSTDKAVNPASVMGASKRLAELIGAALSTGKTVVTSVRFGNVLGSRGSLLPLVAEQVRRRTAVTVTHPDATRYFLSAREAVNLLLGATWLGAGGDILVPELGRPVSVLRVAEALIRQAGLKPYEDIPIVFTGLRPGEKLHEELYSRTEQLTPTEAESVYRITPQRAPASEIDGLASALAGHVAARDVPALIDLMCETLPEYRPGVVVSRAARRRDGE